MDTLSFLFPSPSTSFSRGAKRYVLGINSYRTILWGLGTARFFACLKTKERSREHLENTLIGSSWVRRKMIVLARNSTYFLLYVKGRLDGSAGYSTPSWKEMAVPRYLVLFTRFQPDRAGRTISLVHKLLMRSLSPGIGERIRQRALGYWCN